MKGIFSDIVDTPRLTGTRRYLFANRAVCEQLLHARKIVHKRRKLFANQIVAKVGRALLQPLVGIYTDKPDVLGYATGLLMIAFGLTLIFAL